MLPIGSVGIIVLHRFFGFQNCAVWQKVSRGFVNIIYICVAFRTLNHFDGNPRGGWPELESGTVGQQGTVGASVLGLPSGTDRVICPVPGESWWIPVEQSWKWLWLGEIKPPPEHRTRSRPRWRSPAVPFVRP